MSNKNFILTFTILAVLVWSFSWWGHYAYFLAIGLVENSQFTLNYYLAMVFFLFFLAYIALQIKSLKKDRSGLIPRKIFLSIAGFFIVAGCAILFSLLRLNEPHLANIRSFFQVIRSGTESLSKIPILLSWCIDAEGLDFIFYFLLELLSGCAVYSQKAKFDARGFAKALFSWLVIIFINELIVQRFIPFREGAIIDALYNSIGVVLGLLLASRWFWKS